jgi:hypothetical protein
MKGTVINCSFLLFIIWNNMIREYSQFDDSLLDDEAIETQEPIENDPPVAEEPIENVDNNDGNDGNDEEPTEETPEVNDNDLSAFESFLKSRGVRDGKTIVYENDEGETEEVDFNTLSKDEQLEILNSISDPGLSDDEIYTINYLRQNNASLQDVITYFQQQAVDAYIKEHNVEPTYNVDDYSDDELYFADIKAKYPDMTDDEINDELQLAKTNEDVFKKKCEVIRNNYKAIEENRIKEEKELEAQQQKQYQDSFANVLNSFERITLDYKDPNSDYLILEEDDRNKIFDYVFKPTTSGMSAFVEDLSKPEVIAELAWYRLFGADTISDISGYWKNELKKARKTTTPKNKTQVTVKNTKTETTPTNTNPQPSLSSAWDKLL